MFYIEDDPARQAGVLVRSIHDERGYREIRRRLSNMYDEGRTRSTIEIVDVDLAGDRRLILEHKILGRALLEEQELVRVLQHLADLWGYPVLLYESDDEGTSVKVHEVKPR